MRESGIKKEYVLIFVLFAFFWFGIAVLTKTMFSGFHLTDDYIILQIKNSIDKIGLIPTFTEYMKPEMTGRLRPFYLSFLILRTYLFGSHYILWSMHLLLSATISSFLFYLFARIIKFPISESILFTIYSMLGYQSIIWFHLGYNETLGIIFLSFGFLFLALEIYSEKYNKIYNWLFVIFIFLTIMCKEPFILLIPALIYMKHQIISQKTNISIVKSIKNDYKTIVLLLLLFISSLLYLIFGIKDLSLGYCGISEFEPFSYIQSLIDLSNASFGIPYIIIAIILSCLYEKENKNIFIKFIKENLHIFVVFLLIIIPQCIIYAKSGFFARYLTPASVGYSYLLIYCLKFFRENVKSKLKKFIVYLLLTISILSIFKETFISAILYANKGINAHKVLNLIDEKIKPDKKIVIVGDVTKNFEQTQAFRNYLELQKDAKTNIWYQPIFSKTPFAMSPFELYLITQFQKENQDKLQLTFDNNTNAIIIFKNIYPLFLKQNKNNLKNYNLYDYDNFKVYIKAGL